MSASQGAEADDKVMQVEETRAYMFESVRGFINLYSIQNKNKVVRPNSGGSMRKPIAAICSVGLLAMFWAIPVLADDYAAQVAMGKAVYMDKSRGNCISCHAIADPDATLAGNQGPPTMAMKQRFPDKRILRAQIWDASKNNPLTIMPPLGKHWILSEQEIDAVVEYIYQF